MWVERNSERRSSNHYCSEKAVSITYSERAFEALDKQDAMRMRHTVICGLSGSTMFLNIISKNGKI